ncbi:MAG: hypothetical protein V4508_15585 [Pseudomonadota bacterium]
MKTVWSFLAGVLCGALGLFVFLGQMTPPAAPVPTALASAPAMATPLTAAEIPAPPVPAQFAPVEPLASTPTAAKPGP